MDGMVPGEGVIPAAMASMVKKGGEITILAPGLSIGQLRSDPW